MSQEVLKLSESERTRCEVWSRVMGYHRPITAWNKGKQQEHRDRLQFVECALRPLPVENSALSGQHPVGAA